MARVICLREDGRALRAIEGVTPHDDATEVVVLTDAIPRDLTAWRWDGATGLRPATGPEVSDATAAVRDQTAMTTIDGDRAIKALALVVADLHGLTVAQIRTLFLEKYRGLP